MIFTPSALENRTFLVTGASSGLGRATALLVSQCGGKVIATGRDEARLRGTIDDLSGDGHRSVVASLANADEATALVSMVAGEQGGLHGIFHSAGVELTLPTRLTKQKHLDDVFGAALYGSYGIARAAGKANIMHQGASIVLMSSVAASRGRPGMALYSAAKAGIEGLVKSLACELAVKSVRVNAIAAGGVRTEMHERLTRNLSESAIEQYEHAHLLGFGSPMDVASVAVFLLSDASAWTTGAVWNVDGGYSAS